MTALSAEAIKKIRVGDFVAVRREIDGVAKNDPEFPVRIIDTGEWVSASDIVGHEPRGFRVGDRVRGRSSALLTPARVVFVYKDTLLLEWPSGGVEAHIAAGFERVEDAP